MSDENKATPSEAESSSETEGLHAVPNRPNAAYQLSEKKIEDNNLKFYYSREERLEKAQKSVRDLYNEQKRPRFSFLGPLINGKGRAMLFGSILLICAALMAITIFDPSGNYELSGNRVTVRAIRYEGAIIAVLKKKAVKKKHYTGAVEIGASPEVSKGEAASAVADAPIFYHRIFFSAENTEEYRFSLPFEAERVIMVLQAENASISMKLRVE